MRKYILKSVLSLIGIMVTLSLGTVNAQETCGSGYVENSAGTGCKLVQVTFDANGGSFSGEETIKIVDTRVVEVYERIYKYSHTENVDDNGIKLSNYGNNWNNSNIRGTERTSAVNQAHVLTITGASSLTVDIYYNGIGTYYDWASVWKGSHPSYKATNNYGSEGAVTINEGGISSNKYGGSQNGIFLVNGNLLTGVGYNKLIIPGNTVTFGFNSSYRDGGGYGYYAIVVGETDTIEGYKCYYDIPNPEREGYVFGGWYMDENLTQRFDLSVCLAEDIIVYAKRDEVDTKDIVIEATAVSINQLLKINKYFDNDYTVNWGDGTTGNLSSDTIHIYSGEGTYNIILSLKNTDRWTFQNVAKPLIATNGTTMTGVKIISMPSLVEGFGDSVTTPGDYFFSYFNYNGAITSLPEGSFDTSKITTAGNDFFSEFNVQGSLTSLPEGSFDTSKITIAGNDFFRGFNNYNGAITSLPEGSFDISNITTAGNYFFSYFNCQGQLTSLPENSFRFSTGLTTAKDWFFYYFNVEGTLTSLPEGSFDTSKITTVGNSFFGGFNYNGTLTSLPENSFKLSTGLTMVGDNFFRRFNYLGQLTSLPEGSFDTSKITTVGNDFFSEFNEQGSLTSLPEGSFVISNITTVGNSFFSRFNGTYGQLTSLPEGSFDTSKITAVGNSFFSYFNNNGALTSLPGGSFDVSNINTVGSYFFSNFNFGGSLTSLPEGSFDTSKIATANTYFFYYFNYYGKLTNLPSSFKLSSEGASKGSAYMNAFNSPYYTLNRNVLELVAGITTPSSDENTFSDNQPGRCGVADNWLVNPVGTCDLTVIYNTNGGTEVESDSANLGDKTVLPTTTRIGYIFLGWYDALSGGNKVGDVGDVVTVNESQTLYAQWNVNKDIVLEATATEDNQTLKINKYFANAYTVDRGDGTTGNLTADTTHTYDEAGTYTVTLSTTADRWRFQNVTKPLAPINGTSMTGVKIIYMPSLADGFGVNATNPGDNFFYNFNVDGSLISLPEGSFDTSQIMTAGNNFFRGFNDEGALISLPDGSFDTSQITTAGNYFFRAFNYKGLLTSLPTGSFNISNITTVGNNFFANFNHSGALIRLPNNSFDTSKITKVGNNFFWQFNIHGSLESLPTGSFNISNISGSVGNEFFRGFNFDGQLTSLPENSFNISNISGSVGTRFFYCFNCEGLLESLPEESFNISNITTVGDRFFSSFNQGGQLIGLPDNSFDTSHIMAVGNDFFSQFNDHGALTRLPTGSFNISNISGSVGNEFFYNFNGRGQLTSLPEGSFDCSNITTAGDDFFRQVNVSGQLTSLPENSFNISNLTTVGDNAFRYFNGKGGLLESLPEGSFNTLQITSSGTGFSSYFNYGGKITTLPDSFTLSSIGASKDYGYQNAFDSTGYILNKKVSDLVSGITEPLYDRDTFSDNQPGRCGVHENWLVTTVDACSISYDDGLGGTGEFKYAADTTGVVVGSGIVVPIKTGYTLSGWIDASGNNVDEIVFPDMDGQTLYADWIVNQYALTIDVDGTLTVITGDYGSPITPTANPSKIGYKFIGREPEIPDRMPAEDMTIKAIWEELGTSGGGGGGGGGGGSSSQNNTGSTSSQTGSQTNSNTGSTTSGANEKEPEGTGNNTEIQTGGQVDSQQDEQTPQNDSNTQDSSANASEGQNYSQEFQQAYEFAHENGITTMPTIQKAQMNGKLTRIAMAKMLSQYAVNVLGQKPANIVVPKFNDVTEKMDADYDDGVTLAYQLGIMGQNMPNNRFRPNDEVTRAEFATALSRMIYGTSDGEYKGTGKYYIHHMEKLVEEGIITKDDPNMKELRGYVMIMLMRSAK